MVKEYLKKRYPTPRRNYLIYKIMIIQKFPIRKRSIYNQIKMLTLHIVTKKSIMIEKKETTLILDISLPMFL